MLLAVTGEMVCGTDFCSYWHNWGSSAGYGFCGSIINTSGEIIYVRVTAEGMMYITNPPEEVMHVFRARVYYQVVYLLALDFLENSSVWLWVCLPEVYFHISVARRTYQLPQFDQTCNMQIRAILRQFKEQELLNQESYFSES